jgi:hypothetical protein
VLRRKSAVFCRYVPIFTALRYVPIFTALCSDLPLAGAEGTEKRLFVLLLSQH